MSRLYREDLRLRESTCHDHPTIPELVHGKALPQGKARLAAASTLLTSRHVACPCAPLLALTVYMFRMDTFNHCRKMQTSNTPVLCLKRVLLHIQHLGLYWELLGHSFWEKLSFVLKKNPYKQTVVHPWTTQVWTGQVGAYMWIFSINTV